MVKENSTKRYSLEDLYAVLLKETLPDGFLLLPNINNNLYILYISTNDVPRILISLVIHSTLELTLYNDNFEIPKTKYNHLLSGKIKYVTEVTNVMAFAKSLLQPTKSDLKDVASQCVSLLDDHITRNMEEDSKSVTFLRNRLNLLTKEKNARR